MKTNYNKIIISLEGMKARDLVYPAVVLIFIVAVAIAFSYTAQFISENINKAFLIESPQESLKLDTAAYKVTAQKLNLTIGSSI